MPTEKHKAATEISLIGHREPSLLSIWVNRYGKLGVVAFLSVAGLILFRQFRQTQALEDQESLWSLVRGAVAIDSYGGSLEAEEAKVKEILGRVQGTAVEPWALLGMLHAALEERNYPVAREALGRIAGTHERSLTELPIPLLEGGQAQSLVEWLESRLAAQEAWEGAHARLIQNPPLPENAPKVRLVTSAGEILLGLFQAEAPQHTENFLKLCREGFYVGTKFHRVMPGFMIQGGDPESKEADYEKWGQGGPGYTIAPEKNELSHFRGVLSAAKKPADTESSGSQFFITTGNPHHLDGKHVIFGAVIEGQAVVDAIGEGTLEDQQAGRPERPVEILGTQVL